jgi:multidrug transporter EmrE-like cation transporter
MSAASFALVLAGVILNAMAQLLLKAGADRVGPLELSAKSLQLLPPLVLSAPIVAGLACYAVSVVIWIVALSRVEVSIAYPMLSIGYVITAVAAAMFFGEALTPAKLGGIVAIGIGVWLLAGSGRGA